MSAIDELLYGTTPEDHLESLGDQINKLRTWLLEHQVQYDEMAAKWESVEWLQDAVRLLMMVDESLAKHQPDDPARQAVFLLAQARVSLASVSDQVDILKEFELYRDEYHAVVDRMKAERNG